MDIYIHNAQQRLYVLVLHSVQSLQKSLFKFELKLYDVFGCVLLKASFLVICYFLMNFHTSSL